MLLAAGEPIPGAPFDLVYARLLPVIPAGARHPDRRALQLTVAGDRTTIMTTVT